MRLLVSPATGDPERQSLPKIGELKTSVFESAALGEPLAATPVSSFASAARPTKPHSSGAAYQATEPPMNKFPGLSPARPVAFMLRSARSCRIQRERVAQAPLTNMENLERAMGFEPTTPTLAR